MKAAQPSCHRHANAHEKREASACDVAIDSHFAGRAGVRRGLVAGRLRQPRLLARPVGRSRPVVAARRAGRCRPGLGAVVAVRAARAAALLAARRQVRDRHAAGGRRAGGLLHRKLRHLHRQGDDAQRAADRLAGIGRPVVTAAAAGLRVARAAAGGAGTERARGASGLASGPGRHRPQRAAVRGTGCGMRRRLLRRLCLDGPQPPRTPPPADADQRVQRPGGPVEGAFACQPPACAHRPGCPPRSGRPGSEAAARGAGRRDAGRGAAAHARPPSRAAPRPGSPAWR